MIEYIFQAIAIFILLCCLPAALGWIISKSNSVMLYPFGFSVMMAAFQLCAFPMILLKCRFSYVAVAWCLIILVILVLGIIKKKKAVFDIRQKIMAAKNQIQIKRKDIFLCLIMTLLVLTQVFMYLNYQHIDDDDARFFAEALEAVERNTMLQVNPTTGGIVDHFLPGVYNDIVSPWPFFIALMSKLTGIHPAVMGHKILPVFILIMVYCIYWELAKHFTEGRLTDRCIFVIFACLINMFGFISIYTQFTFLLIRLWQGKAVVAGLLIPFTLLNLIRIYKTPDDKSLYMILCIVNLSMCLASGMGIILGIIEIGIFGGIYILLHRNAKMMFGMAAASIPNVFFFIYNYVILK